MSFFYINQNLCRDHIIDFYTKSLTTDDKQNKKKYLFYSLPLKDVNCYYMKQKKDHFLLKFDCKHQNFYVQFHLNSKDCPSCRNIINKLIP